MFVALKLLSGPPSPEGITYTLPRELARLLRRIAVPHHLPYVGPVSYFSSTRARISNKLNPELLLEGAGFLRLPRRRGPVSK